MGFAETLEKVVRASRGGVEAVFVDGEGEAIAEFTSRTRYDARLVGAHKGIVLSLVRQASARVGDTGEVLSVTIRAGDYSYSLLPVHEDTFLVLVQDQTGLPSVGLRALARAAEEIRAEI